MKHSISWISASLLAAGVALGCQTDGEVAAQAGPTVRAESPSIVQEPEPAAREQQEPEPEPAVREQQDPKPAARGQQDPGPPEFLPNAFPPTVPDTVEHRDAWMQVSCLRCHETGVGEAPEVVHTGMPAILLDAKCRTCHVFVPGSKPRPKPAPAEPPEFEAWAFPPLVPTSDYHRDAWLRGDCLLCHENGIKGAPKIVHRGMPSLLLESKCRTCHVQIRAVDLDGR